MSEESKVTYSLYTDGASKENQTSAGCGYVIYKNKEEIHSGCRYIGNQTNNIAEYTGLLLGVQAAIQLEIKNIDIYCDSKLVVNQVNGKWEINLPPLQSCVNNVTILLNKLDHYTLQWIPREENKRADELSNDAFLKKK